MSTISKVRNTIEGSVIEVTQRKAMATLMALDAVRRMKENERRWVGRKEAKTDRQRYCDTGPNTLCNRVVVTTREDYWFHYVGKPSIDVLERSL